MFIFLVFIKLIEAVCKIFRDVLNEVQQGTNITNDIIHIRS